MRAAHRLRPATPRDWLVIGSRDHRLKDQQREGQDSAIEDAEGIADPPGTERARFSLRALWRVARMTMRDRSASLLRQAPIAVEQIAGRLSGRAQVVACRFVHALAP